MRDSQVKQALTRLESADIDSAEAAGRAKAAMLKVFDSPNHGESGLSVHVDDAGAAAQAIELFEPEDQSQRLRRWPRLWIPAVAAAAAVLAFLIVQNETDQFDPAVVVAADTATDESARAVDGTDDDPTADAPFLDEDLPRLIEGEFSTTALGGTLTFVATDPVWLTRHETGVVGLSRDRRDPLAAEMTMARVTTTTPALDSPLAIDYVASPPPGVTGQVTTWVVDGVDSRSWRGRVDPQTAGIEDCVPSEVCLTLYDTPVVIGLRPGVMNDLVETPAVDGTTFVISAAIPINQYGLRPFETAFDELVATITFDALAPIDDE